MSGLDAVPYVDELVQEYLLFRGFSATLRSFEAERKKDPMHGYKPDKIVDALLGFVQPGFDSQGMMDFWDVLERQFFVHVTSEYSATVKKLRLSLQRYFCVAAMKAGKPEKVTEFFHTFGSELTKSNDDWNAWFGLPYVKTPANDPTFAAFFAKQWSETVELSLHNFLSTIVRGMPLPKILNFNRERVERRALERENSQLKSALNGAGAGGGGGSGSGSAGGSFASLASDDASGIGPKFRPPSAARSTSRRSMASTPSSSGMRRRRSSGGGGGAGSSSMAINDPRRGSASSATAARLSRVTSYVVVQHRVFNDSSAPITVVRYSASGALVAAGSDDGSVRVWAPPAVGSAGGGSPNGVPVGSLGRRSGASSLAKAGVDASASGGGSGSGSTSSPELTGSFYCGVGGSPVTALAFDPHERFLVAGTSDRRLKVWDVAKRETRSDVTTDEPIAYVLDLQFHPTRDTFVAAMAARRWSHTGVLSLWTLGRSAPKMDRFALHQDAPYRINATAFNGSGSMLAAACSDGHVRVLDTSSWTTVQDVVAVNGGEVLSVRFAGDQASILVVTSDGMLSMLSLAKPGSQLASIELSDFPGSSSGWDTVRLGVDPRAEAYIVSSGTKTAGLYGIVSDTRLQKIQGHASGVVAVDWHPTEDYVVTGSLDTSVRIHKLLAKANASPAGARK